MYYGWITRLLHGEIKKHQELVEQQLTDEIEIVDRFHQALETIGAHTETRNFSELAGMAAARLIILAYDNNSSTISNEKAFAFLSILIEVFTDLLQADRNAAMRLALMYLSPFGIKVTEHVSDTFLQGMKANHVEESINGWLNSPNDKSLQVVFDGAEIGLS